MNDTERAFEAILKFMFVDIKEMMPGEWKTGYGDASGFFTDEELAALEAAVEIGVAAEGLRDDDGE